LGKYSVGTNNEATFTSLLRLICEFRVHVRNSFARWSRFGVWEEILESRAGHADLVRAIAFGKYTSILGCLPVFLETIDDGLSPT
jgi:hypothetical protein